MSTSTPPSTSPKRPPTKTSEGGTTNTQSKSSKSSTIKGASPNKPREPCPYPGCDQFPLSLLTPARRKDHIEVHKAFNRMEQLLLTQNIETTELYSKMDITTTAILSVNLRGFPQNIEPNMLNRLTYARILGFPPLAATSLVYKYSENNDQTFFVDGIALTSIEALEIAYKRELRFPRYCDRPGCNMIETTWFSKHKLEGHNWLHDQGMALYSETPAIQWLYDMEAGYYFDGVTALWNYLEKKTPQTPQQTAMERNKVIKIEVIAACIKYGWEVAPTYMAIKPSSSRAEFLYGTCFTHKLISKIICKQGECNSTSIWKIISSLIGRIEVPSQGKINTLRPEPAVRLNEIRKNSNRLNAVNTFTHMFNSKWAQAIKERKDSTALEIAIYRKDVETRADSVSSDIVKEQLQILEWRLEKGQEKMGEVERRIGWGGGEGMVSCEDQRVILGSLLVDTEKDLVGLKRGRKRKRGKSGGDDDEEEEDDGDRSLGIKRMFAGY